MKLWQNGEHKTEIHFYEAENKKSDITVIIFAGGGYSCRAPHEDKGYAEFLQKNGVNSFIVDYRVAPNRFPIPLLDARRALRFVRANAKKFNVNPDKLAVMGSSAGGHLAAMLSTYSEAIEGEGVDEIDKERFFPDYQILCYPVILNPHTGVAHEGSYKNLLGDRFEELMEKVDPAKNASHSTCPAFIWHTSFDQSVNVTNSYLYAKALKENEVPVEMHIFPFGRHGLGLAESDSHVAQWGNLLLNWLEYMDNSAE